MESLITTAINELINSSSVQKTKVGQIRELLPEIERAQMAGIQLVDIAKVLAANGMAGIDLKCLQNLLYQARKKRVPLGGCEVSNTRPVRQLPVRKVLPAGIDADSILAGARNSMKSSSASTITLGLLRSKQSTHERKEQ